MTEFPHPKFDLRDEGLDERTRVLTVTGEIHVTTAPELSEHLDRALAGGCDRLVLDLAGVEFIDSTGLSVLLNALRRLTRRDGAMPLVCTNPTVLRLFEITRLDSTFDIVSTREEALAHVGAQATGRDAGAP